MVERLLIPLDGSETAEAVFPQVGRLLKRRDSEVVLVRAVDVPPIPEADYGRLIDELQRQARGYVEGVERRLAEDGVRVRSVVRVGPPAPILLAAAEEAGATLIAMTTHGRSGLARFVFGSVAEKILRASPIPVLILRSFRAGGNGGPVPVRSEARPIRRILVPVDGSRASIEILPHAIAFAKLFGARVDVLNVKEAGGVLPPPPFAGSTVGSKGGAPAFPSDPTAEDLVKFAAQSFAAADIPTITMEVSGDPASEILAYSQAQSVDLIAMTTHGRTGPSRWVLGSITEKVLRAASGPMLVVRAARKA